jgi:transcriptional regulator with XRE-family HTH domain
MWQVTVSETDEILTRCRTSLPLFAKQRFETTARVGPHMAGTGARLRAIRLQWHLSLREVEERSRRIAQERGDLSYQVSAGWLARLERGKHELTVNKLTALTEIYSIPLDQLLRAVYPRNAETQNPNQLSSPNATELPTEGLGKVPARRSLGAKPPLVGLSPDETTLLPSENGPSRTPYLRAIIGKLDLTLDPMIPAGSIVQIDTRKPSGAFPPRAQA